MAQGAEERQASHIQATGLSDAWVNKYLWQNERQEEEERYITVDWQENRTGFPSLWGRFRKRKKSYAKPRPTVVPERVVRLECSLSNVFISRDGGFPKKRVAN